MKRDLAQLSTSSHDVLIIGGGIHGACIAYELTKSGYKIALIEQKDFSSGTSANSLKIIHGGFRYLQYLNFRKIRESVKSRREIMSVAPNFVKPLPCMMPTFGHGLRGKEMMQLALLLNDAISWDRNHNLNRAKSIPRGKIISKEQCLKHIPHLRKENLNGAVIWHDGLAVNTERLTLTFILKSVGKGAVVANYLKATGLNLKNKTISGATVEDTLSGGTFDIKASTIVNASGPWLEKILPSSSDKDPLRFRWVKAINIIVKKSLFKEHAVGLEGDATRAAGRSFLKNNKRLFFFVPWRGYTMIGTAYKEFFGDPDRFQIDKQDIDELIDEVNRIYPAADLSSSDVTFFHSGLLPALPIKNDLSDARIDNRSVVIDHWAEDKIANLFSIKGVKYTTAPQTAKQVKNILEKKGINPTQKQSRKEIREDKKTLSYHERSTIDTIPSYPTAEIAEHFRINYGNRNIKLFDYIAQDSKLASLVSHDPLLTAAEVLFFVREEMALKLSDIVFRRSDLGTAECPSKDVLMKVADLMADELGWSEIRKKKEISEVILRYKL